MSDKDVNSLNVGPILINNKPVSYQEAVQFAKTPLQNKIIGLGLLVITVILWILGDKPEPEYNGIIVILGWATLGLAIYLFTRKRKIFFASTE